MLHFVARLAASLLVVSATRASAQASSAAVAEGPSPSVAHSATEQTVTVVGARPRALSASKSLVTARELAAVPLRNAEDALRLVPGLTLVQHGSEGKGHQFFLRGFDAVHGADLELTVEGIPINEWSNVHGQGYIDLGFVIPETIERVEVQKGPFTLDQGAFGMAGSAGYRLGIREQDLGVRATYTAGTTNRQRGVVTYSPRDGDGHDFVAVEALHDDGFGQNRDIDRGALLARTRLTRSRRHGELSFLGSAYAARFALPGTLREDDVDAGHAGFYDSYDRAARGRSARGLAGLIHEWHTSSQKLRTTAYAGYRQLELLENYTGFLLDPLHGDRRHQTQDTFSFGVNLAHDAPLSERLTLHTGLGVRGDVFEQRQDHVDQQETPLAAERRLGGLQALLHALGGLGFRASEPLRFVGGARVDVAEVAIRDGLSRSGSNSEALATVSPRVSGEWQPQPSIRLFAAYGRGFRPPEARSFSSFEPELTGLTDDVYDGGEPKMTLSDSFELGTRWNQSRHFGARLCGFATFIERELVFDHVSGVNLDLNATRRLGAELDVRVDPADWLTLEADVTYVDARFVDSGNAVPLAPQLVGGARAIVTHSSGLHAGLRLFALGARPLPHGARGAPMTTLDATVGYGWRWLRLHLELENVLNQRYREGEYHYASHWRREQPASEIPVVHYVAGAPINARMSVSALF